MGRSQQAWRGRGQRVCGWIAVEYVVVKVTCPVPWRLQVAAALAELGGYHAVEASLQSKQLLGETRTGLSKMTNISHVRCREWRALGPSAALAVHPVTKNYD